MATPRIDDELKIYEGRRKGSEGGRWAFPHRAGHLPWLRDVGVSLNRIAHLGKRVLWITKFDKGANLRVSGRSAAVGDARLLLERRNLLAGLCCPSVVAAMFALLLVPCRNPKPPSAGPTAGPAQRCQMFRSWTRCCQMLSRKRPSR